MDKLTVEQLFAFNSFIKFIENEDTDVFRLTGSAGVGKTFLTIKMIQCALKFYDLYDIIILCPTHKALHVIKNKYESMYKYPLKFQTIASYLVKKIKYNEDGTKSFKCASKTKCKERLIFIDESSMLSDEDLELLFRKEGAKLVFIGDSAQLEPIDNDGMAKIFNDEYLNEKSIKFIDCNLKQVVRTKNNELTDLYQHFRNFVEGSESEIEFKKDWYNPNLHENILFVETQTKFLELIRDKFTLEKECKIITYRNEKVREYNSFVRKCLFDTDDLYVVGEKLIFNEPYNDIFNNNDEVEIKNIEKTEMKHPNGNVYKVYVMNTTCGNEIITLQEQSKNDYHNYFNNWKKQIVVSKNRPWKRFYQEFYLFNAPCNYSYAITTHKAQGSTIDMCFVDLKDIYNTLIHVDSDSLEKTLYTAISRASEKLYCYFP